MCCAERTCRAFSPQESCTHATLESLLILVVIKCTLGLSEVTLGHVFRTGHVPWSGNFSTLAVVVFGTACISLSLGQGSMVIAVLSFDWSVPFPCSRDRCPWKSSTFPLNINPSHLGLRYITPTKLLTTNFTSLVSLTQVSV